jgi:lysophospholipid acyltransferase (LPLAT)-like uncharacterized protein
VNAARIPRSAVIVSYVLSGYFRAVARSATVCVYLPTHSGVHPADARQLQAVVESLLTRGPLILPFWNAHSMLLVASYLADPCVHALGRTFEAIADDSVGGRTTQALFGRLGLKLRLLRFNREDERLQDIRGILSDAPNIAVAVDSHGPYRTVGAALPRLARTLTARMLPVALYADRTVKVFRKIKMSFPLPQATIHLAFGRPLESTDRSVKEMSQDLTCALASLESDLLSCVQLGK